MRLLGQLDRNFRRRLDEHFEPLVGLEFTEQHESPARVANRRGLGAHLQPQRAVWNDDDVLSRNLVRDQALLAGARMHDEAIGAA